MQLRGITLSEQRPIERAILTWVLATFNFIAVQYLRNLYLSACSYALTEIGEKNVLGFIPWTDPGGFGFRFPTLYRIMHNITIPYVMIFYVILFFVIFLLNQNKTFTHKGYALFRYGCLLVHILFLTAYNISLFLPYDIFGTTIALK
jgi:hypothetical protein